jgi:hypothetical protein
LGQRGKGFEKQLGENDRIDLIESLETSGAPDRKPFVTDESARYNNNEDAGSKGE